MPNYEPSGEPERPTPRGARDEAKLILGQIHGVVWHAVKDVEVWLKPEQTTTGGEPGLTPDDIRRAATEVHGHFGTVHAALNTGEYDEELARVGMTGDQGQAQRRGSRSAIGRFFTGLKRATQDYVARLRGSLRWSGTIIGSITAALKKEIERVRGAAAAGEAIKEFIEVLLNATEPPEGSHQPLEVNATEPPEGRQATRRAQQRGESGGGLAS